MNIFGLFSRRRRRQPSCPQCGSLDLHTGHEAWVGDLSQLPRGTPMETSWSRCPACGYASEEHHGELVGGAD